jgi:hypothetical protein
MVPIIAKEGMNHGRVVEKRLIVLNKSAKLSSLFA